MSSDTEISDESKKTLDLERPHDKGKIDGKTGDFFTYSGITIIANVKDRLVSGSQWEEAHNFIARDPVLSKYYTPLPCSSYHMTVCGLPTVAGQKDKSPKTFNAYLVKNKEAFINLWNMMNKDDQYIPEGTMTGIGGSSVISITMDHSVKSATHGKRICDACCRDLGVKHSASYRSHITLAYKYRSIGIFDQISVKKAIGRLWKILKVLEVEFEPANLMIFQDMTAFVPTNPNNWSDEPLLSVPLTDPSTMTHAFNCRPVKKIEEEEKKEEKE